MKTEKKLLNKPLKNAKEYNNNKIIIIILTIGGT